MFLQGLPNLKHVTFWVFHADFNHTLHRLLQIPSLEYICLKAPDGCRNDRAIEPQLPPWRIQCSRLHTLILTGYGVPLLPTGMVTNLRELLCSMPEKALASVRVLGLGHTIRSPIGEYR